MYIEGWFQHFIYTFELGPLNNSMSMWQQNKIKAMNALLPQKNKNK